MVALYNVLSKKLNITRKCFGFKTEIIFGYICIEKVVFEQCIHFVSYELCM